LCHLFGTQGAAVGIETRRNGTTYYYKKRRENGRVVSEYVAAGAFGQLLYEGDRLDREAQAVERAAQRERARVEAEGERAAWELLAEAQQLAALALLATGHHRHRGQWRRRREARMGIAGSNARLSETLEERARAELHRRRKQAEQAERAALPPLPAPGDYSSEAVKAIMKRCDRNDAAPEDIAALRALLKERSGLLKDGGGSIHHALTRELADMNATGLVREILTSDIEIRRRDLGYSTAPALERPLIDHLLLCELRMGLIEQHYTAKWGAGMSLDTARFWEGRLSAAQRRYLAAVECLARVRRVRVELARINPDGSAEAVAVERPGA
jgi:hypothetical protein